ncbi:MAG: transposase [Deltaproteobacteria bacterium]|jgi:transposase|nr:transposase [Deltaproteobacteria bacterium]
MNCKLFIKFLNTLIRTTNNKIFLILDNLRVQHGKLVQEWLNEHGKEVDIFFLPPYSPELNPDEYFNHIVKNKLHSEPQAADKDEFERKIGGILRSFQKNKPLIKNLFLNKHIQYALEWSRAINKLANLEFYNFRSCDL